MFNSFLDGTKSAIEMAAVANAADLDVAYSGLTFPPCGVDDLPSIRRPSADGGVLPGRGMVQVVSSLETDSCGRYAGASTRSEYVRRCFAEYGLKTDAPDGSGWYGAMLQALPSHRVRTRVSIASIMTRGELTGAARGFRGDVASTASAISPQARPWTEKAATRFTGG